MLIKKHLKNTVYNYNITNRIPKLKINDLVRISLKRRELFDEPSGNINPFITASRGRVKKIFDCFFLVYWVHLNDIYQILGGWFTRCLETSMYHI